MYGEEVSDTQRHDETMGVQYNYLTHAESVQCNARPRTGIREPYILYSYTFLFILVFRSKISVRSAK